ncbi:hypothetical protein [Pseudogracilibacillus auburnensis]|uniref:hypothetical protein n=1 Tax=Pseudogracilibacillus auburnensis TaxID=1494959 RepID=UPI001F6137C0|nr:hypothetical protein [Pseudogracilibacillus auburnensis]
MLRYFAGGNTAKGFFNLYDSTLANLGRVFILTGRSTKEKTDIIKRIIETGQKKQLDVEVIHSPFGENELDGVIIRDIGFAIVDGDPPRVLGKEFIGADWETIDLDQADRTAHVDVDEINEIKQKMDDQYRLAYREYANGLRVHDDWEKIYIDKMDFKKADEVTSQLISRLFQHIDVPAEKVSEEIHRFLGAATPKGSVDFVNNLTAGLSARYFLKGRAGTGKSTVLRKIVAEAKRLGLDMEIYHCGFDPNSLDMVLVRELGWAVFDSTKPHEYFPELPGDEVIDMYELTVAPGTDELFAQEIAEIEAKYRTHMNAGTKYLAEAKKYRDQLEEIYLKVADTTFLEQIFVDIDKEIQLLINNQR